MTTIKAEIVADSISEAGDRITTFSLKFPRFILPQFNTHRVFSRNASSSRAIPTEKMIKAIEDDPAMPIEWGTNQRGMQAGELHDDPDNCKTVWRAAVTRAVETATIMNYLGLHKQIVNRVLEPFAHISVVCTATEYANFYNLRNHPDAQPEIKRLAEVMLEAHRDSEPKELRPGQWHLPYVRDNEVDCITIRNQLECSVARCARVSYLTHEGKEPNIKNDLKLHTMLLESKHMSCFEHQSTPIGRGRNGEKVISGNFKGWKQYRKTIKGENQTEYDY